MIAQHPFIVAYEPVSSALQANRPTFRVNAVFIHSGWTQRECVWDSSKSATRMFLGNGRCGMYVARCLRTYVVFCTRPPCNYYIEANVIRVCKNRKEMCRYIQHRKTFREIPTAFIWIVHTTTLYLFYLLPMNEIFFCNAPVIITHMCYY